MLLSDGGAVEHMVHNWHQIEHLNVLLVLTGAKDMHADMPSAFTSLPAAAQMHLTGLCDYSHVHRGWRLH